MSMHPSVRKWLFGFAGIGLALAGSTRLAPLDAIRDANKLALPPIPEVNRPAMLWTPLLAVGRAPLVDYLWLRATKLKDSGRFFDAFQLSQMICELQPHFASVWAFQGWNMAYNISVTLKTPEERWRWVRNGYELIRDKGIPLNPNNTQLYRELAWILFHKVGDFMDEMHYYYKLQFALQMQDILGPPPEGFLRPGQVEGDYYRDYPFQSLAEAPQSLPQLTSTPGVPEFVEKLKAFGFDATQPGAYLNLLQGLRDGKAKVPNAPEGQELDRLMALRRLMEDPAERPARDAIERYWRALRLRTEVRLDPARIVALQEEFGITFDFRLAEAHALYWASVGLEMGGEVAKRIDTHRLNTTRIEFFCIKNMFQRGRMSMSHNADIGEPPLLSPDIRFIPILFESLVRESKEYLEFERQKSPVSENFKTTFVGFMRVGVLRYHESGMDKEGRELFEYLRKTYPDSMYEKGYDHFIAAQFEINRELNNFAVGQARVQSLIARAIREYGYDEDDAAVRAMARAKKVFDDYQKQCVNEQQKIPRPFKALVEEVVHEYGGRMYHGTYEIICRKLGVIPLTASSQPG